MTEARKKAPVRTQARRKKTGQADNDIVKRYDLKVYYIPVDDLKKYPSNPNIGGAEEAIEESLSELGQYMPLRVQKSTMYILGGNHTYDELVKLGATEVACFLFDISDTEAKKMVIGDNHIGRLAHINRTILADLMVSLPDPRGTGFTDEDMAIMNRIAEDGIAAMEEMGGEDGLLSRLHRETLGDIDTPDSEDNADYGTVDDEIADAIAPTNDLAKMSEDLPGMYDLKEEMQFDSKHPLGYPPLRADMMVDELPQPLDSWAGSATRDDPRGDQVWWLYNYGIDSTSGMADLSKIVLSFYCWDDYFENWFWFPAKHTAKALNSGIKYAITPNFSMWIEDPPVVRFYNLYRSRWVGRYFQEAGIRVIPDLQWGLGHPEAIDLIDKHTSYGLPRPLKYAAMQLQNSSERFDDASFVKTALKEIRHAVKKCEVENLIVYSGRPGRDLVQGNDLGTNVIWLPNRNMKLSASKKRKESQKEDSGTI